MSSACLVGITLLADKASEPSEAADSKQVNYKEIGAI
jgi:hypothetical protein